MFPMLHGVHVAPFFVPFSIQYYGWMCDTTAERSFPHSLKTKEGGDCIYILTGISFKVYLNQVRVLVFVRSIPIKTFYSYVKN